MKRSRTVAMATISALFVAGLALTGVAQSAQAATFTPTTVRSDTNLNATWKFIASDPANAQAPTFNDSAWSSVSLPHTWNGIDGQNGGNNYYRGPGWYRKHVTPSTSLAGKKLWLQFGAASESADVYVNGTLVGHHDGAFTAFRFDVTSQITLGSDNVIAVKVNNVNNVDVAPNAPNFTISGGLIRGVDLIAVNPLSITAADYGGPGVYLTTPSVNATSATVTVTTKLANNSTTVKNATLHTVITDAANNIVASGYSGVGSIAVGGSPTAVQTFTVTNPHLWNGKADPYLYSATVEIFDGSTRVDSVTQPLGIRYFSVSSSTGLSLNGQHLAVHGVVLTLDNNHVGFAASDADHVQDFQIMNQMGVNAIRSSIGPDSQKVFDLADQQGYIVYPDLPLVNNVVTDAAFTANVESQLHEMIQQNYNHASVLFWGMGNEIYGDNTTTNTLLQDVVDLSHTLDPSRLTMYASCCNNATSDFNGRTDLIGFNTYNGWYSGVSTDMGTFLDGLHSSKPAWKVGISEYGAGGNTTQHAEPSTAPSPNGTSHPEEVQSALLESWWNQIQARPYIWGSFTYTMFDVAADNLNSGPVPGINDKGVVTIDRQTKKDGFYWFEANWTSTPLVHLNSANWTNRTVAATQVKAYVNASNVTLKVNGVQVGAAQSGAGHVATWNITLNSGANTIVVSGTNGGTTYTDSATWTLS